MQPNKKRTKLRHKIINMCDGKLPKILYIIISNNLIIIYRFRNKEITMGAEKNEKWKNENNTRLNNIKKIQPAQFTLNDLT